MNIKNETVHALAREAAERSGLSQTSVVEAALRQYLSGLPQPATAVSRADVVRQRVAEFNLALSDDDRRHMREAADGLYDEEGLFA